MKKIEYVAPEMTVIVFATQDILTTSGDGVDLPLDPAPEDDGTTF